MSKNEVTDLFLQRYTGGFFKSERYFSNNQPSTFGRIINRIHCKNGRLKIIHLCSGVETEIVLSQYEFLEMPKENKIIFRSADQGHALILMDTSIN